MKILFLSDNFPPESNVPATRTYEHAVRWIQMGHQVTVITGAPNFPEGIVHEGYKNNWYSLEEKNGIRIVRVKTFITANNGFFKRVFDFISFMVSGFFAGLFEKQPDVIIATSPQFFTACAGWALAKVKRRPFVFEMRDLWPESIIAVGEMKENWLLKCVEWLELFLYRQADLIIAVTQGLKNNLIARGIPADKIQIIVNGVDLSRYSPVTVKDVDFAKQYALDNKFVIGYVGNHGRAYDLFKILEAAQQLQAYKDVVFIFVGGGVMREKLLLQFNAMALSNVRIIAKQPQHIIPRILSLCDISLIPLKTHPLIMGTIPTKMLESFSMGLPVILGMPEQSDGAKILMEHDCGLVIEPESVQCIVDAVLYMFENKKEIIRFEGNCLQASMKFSRDILAKKYIQLLENCLEKK
ncbi:MAG: glycosyltransferase family 4 protein [Methylococcaceae bacterium]|nr:glycosyltransferase family 4 protein [Methylococcaceae bacterium]